LALAALLVVGCYRPNLEDSCQVSCAPDGNCPNGSHCEAGRCTPDNGTCPELPDADIVVDPDAVIGQDGSIDAPADAPIGTLCPPQTFTTVTPIATGAELTMSSNYRRAALLTFNPGVGYVVSVADTAQEVDQPTTQYVEQIYPTGIYAQLAYPRITPDGGTIYMRATDTSANTYIVSSVRNAVNGAWGLLTPVQFQTLAGTPATLAAGTATGTPSATSPRRMPMSVGVASFDEVEEVGNNVWRLKSTITPASLGVLFIREPSFTPDGRRVVFVGSTQGNPNNAIYVAARTSLTSPFGTAVLLHDDPNNVDESSPFFTTDCSRVIYTNRIGPQVLRAQ
jgi:hypothetical protein